MWVIPLALLVLFEAIADVFAKEWSLRGHPLRWLLAIGAYVIANAFWLVALRGGAGLARGAVLFSLGSALLAVFLGLLLYQESVSRLQVAGMMLGILATALLLSNGSA